MIKSSEGKLFETYVERFSVWVGNTINRLLSRTPVLKVFTTPLHPIGEFGK